MKYLLPLILIVAVLTGCAGQTNQQKLATAEQLVAVAIDGYVATNGGKTITPAALQTISSNLFAVAAQAQGNVGTTPTAANVAQGSALPVLGSNVQQALPNAPITQAQVNQIFQAAQMTGGK